MTHNLCATVYVYRHRETGAISALYADDARAMIGRDDYEHVASLEPRMWIEHHFDDAIKEREACAKVCRDEAEQFMQCAGSMTTGAYDWKAEGATDCAEAILAQGEK